MSAHLRAKWRLPYLLAGILLSLLTASPAWAAVYTWDGGAGTNNWADGANWDPDIAGGPVDGDDIIFNANTILSLGVSRSVNSTTINGGAVLSVLGNHLSLTTADLTINAPGTDIVLSLADGSFIVTNQFNQGANAFTLSGIGGLEVQGAGTITGTGALTMSNGTQLYVYGNQTIYLAAAAHDATTRINLANSCTLGINVGAGTADFNGIIQGAGNLRKLGAGNLALYGLNTYTGSTTVSAGALGAVDTGVDYNQLPDTTDLIIAAGATCVVDDQDLASLAGSGTFFITNGTTVVIWGTGNHTFDGDIEEDLPSGFVMDGPGSITLNGTVYSDLVLGSGTVVLNGTAVWDIYGFGGNLMGTGTCMGALGFMAGTFMPGSSIGTFTVGAGGALGFLDPDADLTIEVNGEASDQIVVNGPVDLFDGALSVQGVPFKGAEFTIIEITSADTVTGNFTGLPEGTEFTSGGYQYKITYVGGDGNDVVLTALTGGDPGPIPQPPSRPIISQGTSPNPTTSLNGPVLTWPKVKNADSYRVYRAECPTCTRSELGQVTGNSLVGSSLTVNEDYVSFVDSSAQPGQAYYYWIRAQNSDGMSNYSNWMVAWRYEQNPGRAGDFNGDGIMDLLWWDPASNNIQAWFLRDGEVWSLSPQSQGLDISQWLLMGTGDFNGDKFADLLWWNPATGEVQFWLAPFDHMPMPRSAGFTKTSASLDNMTGNGTIAVTGDINSDGITDIIWRDYATGQVTLWLMGEDGKPQLNGPPSPADPSIVSYGRPGVSGALDWQVGGLADANGNGRADVFWRNAKDNRIITWFMDGSVITDLAEENRGLDLAWRFSGLGDLDGDRLADIVWRRQSDGALKAWLMQSGVFSQEQTMLEGSAQAKAWQVKAVGAFCKPGCDDVYCKNPDSGAALIMNLAGGEHHPSAE